MSEPLPPAAQPEYLTQALRRAAALADAASVHDVQVDSVRPTILSRIIRLRLTYDGPAAAAPATLILKTAQPERIGGGWNGGRQEVAFYRDVAPTLPPGLTPRCFDAHWDPAAETWHVLLEDLTDTHHSPTTWPLPPSAAVCGDIVAARARCHAALWNDPRLGRTLGEPPDPDGFLDRSRDVVTRFFDRYGSQLPAGQRAWYDRLLAAAPRLLAPDGGPRRRTIIHGDAHVWNCFLPRDGGADVRLFDWDSWRVGNGATDLAYMMATHWYPDLRREREAALLDRYHAVLLAAGVTGYDRATLQADYRLAVLWQTMTPVWQAMHGIPPVIWWNHLGRTQLAADDWACRDLL